MEQINVRITYLRSTKNKHVYTDGDEGVFGSLYIPREILPTDPPQALHVAIVLAVEDVG